MVGMSILEKRFVWRRPEAERRRRPLQLSQLERDNVRRGLRSLLAKYGRVRLARAMGLSYDALRKTIKRAPTMRVAVLVAFVARVEVPEVLAGAWPRVCPSCGRSG
jgi:cytochrome c-type biogenesis protein CcmH/NrfG